MIRDDYYIFKSREGSNKPISRQQALNILKDAAAAVGITENVGTHTLRKTWGYHAWKKGFSPALISLSIFFKWALDQRLIKANPAEELELLKEAASPPGQPGKRNPADPVQYFSKQSLTIGDEP